MADAMQLSDLGFDAWFEAHAGALHQVDQAVARVSAVDRGAYRVRDANKEVSAEPTGKLYFRADSPVDLPCVGDWVSVQYHSDDTAAVIHGLFPRRTFLRRKCAGANVDYQMIAANIDTAFIVQSCRFDFNPRRMERYLVMAADGGVAPVIVLTKTDLIAEEELAQKLAVVQQTAPAVPVIALSNVTGTGFDQFQQVLRPGRTYGLLGSSGVGKTTLINRLIGRDAFKTEGVSATGEGTHTTSRRQLIVLDQGALMIDTPGMRELGLLGADEGVAQGFEDILAFALDCRYADCSHVREPGCAVLAAVQSGALNKGRYANYLKLKKESGYYEMSYADKRKKDRAFGRLIKTAMKRMKD